MPRRRSGHESRRAGSATSSTAGYESSVSARTTPARSRSAAAASVVSTETSDRAVRPSRKRRKVNDDRDVSSTPEPDPEQERQPSQPSREPSSEARIVPTIEIVASANASERGLSPASDQHSVASTAATSSKVKIEDEGVSTEQMQEVGFETTEVKVDLQDDLRPSTSTEPAEKAKLDDNASEREEDGGETSDYSATTPRPTRGRGRPRKKKTFPPMKRTAADGTATPPARATRANVTLPNGYIEGIKSSRVSRTPKSDTGTPNNEEYRGKGRWKQKIRMHGPLTEAESIRRDTWLEQLKHEEAMVKDETHPIILAVRETLRKEREQKVQALHVYLSEIEAEYERQLKEATEIAWRRWADDKDELRMALYFENHEKLKQVYAEEKDYSFIQEHPLFRDYRGVPPVPYYRNAVEAPQRDSKRSSKLAPPPLNPALLGKPDGLDKMSIESDLDVMTSGPKGLSMFQEPAPSPTRSGFVVRPPGGPRIWYAGPARDSDLPASPPRKGAAPQQPSPSRLKTSAAPNAANAFPPAGPSGSTTKDSSFWAGMGQQRQSQPIRLPPIDPRPFSAPRDLSGGDAHFAPSAGPTSTTYMPAFMQNQPQPEQRTPLGSAFDGSGHMPRNWPAPFPTTRMGYQPMSDVGLYQSRPPPPPSALGDGRSPFDARHAAGPMQGGKPAPPSWLASYRPSPFPQWNNG